MTRLWLFHLQLAEMHVALIQLQAKTYLEAVTGAGNWLDPI